jgi:predicted RNA methylase
VDRQHDALKLLMNGNLVRKIRNPRSVLDLGTGKGSWAVEVAQEFPTADEVVGVDIETLAPANYPPNCRFEVPLYHVEMLMADRGCVQRHSVSRELLFICPLAIDDVRCARLAGLSS